MGEFMLRATIAVLVLIGSGVGAFGQAGDARRGSWRDGAFVLARASELGRDVVAFRFDWAVPATFRVLHRQKKGAHDTLVEHVMRVSRVGGSTDMIVRCASTRVLELNGRDYRDVKASRDLGRVFALPDVRVAQDGRLVGAVAFAKFVERNARDLERTLETSPEGRKRLALMRRAIRAPRALACLERVKTAFWNEWVGLWLGRSIRVGGHATIADGGPTPNGRLLRLAARIRHRGAARGDAGRVRLDYRRIVRGRDALESIRSFTDITPDGRPIFAEGRIAPGQTVELVQWVRVVTDPNTLRPATVETKHTASMRFGKTVERTVEHEFTFDWSGQGERDVR